MNFYTDTSLTKHPMQHLLARAGHQQPGTQGYSSRALSEQTHFCSRRQESLNSLTGKSQSQSYTSRAETLGTKEGEEEKKRLANNRKRLLTTAMPVQLGYKNFKAFWPLTGSFLSSCALCQPTAPEFLQQYSDSKDL